jgi:predicted Na+-dependent transporter
MTCPLEPGVGAILNLPQSGIVASLCVLAFASRWLIAGILRAGHTQQTSLTFRLGMNNNGTGLVLASMKLANHPRLLLPIIFYNLVQHLVAAGVDVALCRRPGQDGRRELMSLTDGFVEVSDASLVSNEQKVTTAIR